MKCIFRSSGGCKPKAEVWVDVVSPESSLLGLQMATFLLCAHTAFPLYVYIPGVSSSSLRDSSPIRLGPTLVTSFYPNYLFKSHHNTMHIPSQ